MDILLMIYIALLIMGIVLIGITLLVNTDKGVFVSTILSSLFVSFIGFMNYSSMPMNYPNRKTLALLVALTFLIPFALNILKIKNENIKLITIKLTAIFSILLNILTMFFL